MINRREFTLGAAGAVVAGSSGIQALAAGTPTQEALIIDAMGEIREVYTEPALLMAVALAWAHGGNHPPHRRGRVV